MLIDNWRVIINNAYSVRVSLATAVAATLLAWHAKSVEALIPAALAVANIIVRIIPQPDLHKEEK